MESLSGSIIYEDNDVLIIAKPAGLVVNRAETVAEETLQDKVEDYLGLEPKDKNSIFEQRSGIAHRLDKETSGVMVIGKTPEALAKLMAQFKAREIKKEYIALVHGLVSPKTNTINLPVGRSPYNRHKFRVDVFGKPAVTKYKVEEEYNGFSLVRLFPKTGRTHQIRVHMAHLNHSLVGDEVYGGRKRAEKDRKWCPRHFLHAAVLELTHPSNGKYLRFEAMLPPDLERALNEAKGI